MTGSLSESVARALRVLRCVVATLSLAVAAVDAQPRRDFAKVNVCEMVPGTTVAKAMGGTLAESRPFFDKMLSRCTYFVTLEGKTSPAAFVVWMQAPEDFEELRQYIDSPQTAVAGLGDGAYLFHDNGDGRFKINVLKKGDLMFQATADSADSARKLADAVAAELWKNSRVKDYAAPAAGLVLHRRQGVPLLAVAAGPERFARNRR